MPSAFTFLRPFPEHTLYAPSTVTPGHLGSHVHAPSASTLALPNEGPPQGFPLMSGHFVSSQFFPNHIGPLHLHTHLPFLLTVTLPCLGAPHGCPALLFGQGDFLQSGASQPGLHLHVHVFAFSMKGSPFPLQISLPFLPPIGQSGLLHFGPSIQTTQSKDLKKAC